MELDDINVQRVKLVEVNMLFNRPLDYLVEPYLIEKQQVPFLLKGISHHVILDEPVSDLEKLGRHIPCINSLVGLSQLKWEPADFAPQVQDFDVLVVPDLLNDIF